MTEDRPSQSDEGRPALATADPASASLPPSPSPGQASQKNSGDSPLAGSPLEVLPLHVQELLVKSHVSRTPCCLSPYRCVLTRHPIHRDATDAHIASLVTSIRDSGFDETLSARSPLVAVRYSKPIAIPSKAAGSSKTMVQQSWGDHPLVYVISGAGRGEAVGQLVQKESEHPNVKSQQKGLGFFLINSGENLTAWEIFLLSTALNAADPNSRPPNYFERTDQIAFICWELSNRKECDATFRDIAVEICFNPFLAELCKHLNLSSSMVPLFPLAEAKVSPEVFLQLVHSRSIFPYLPAGMGVLTDKIPPQPLEALDVLIDMATCVNSDRMKRVSPEAAQAKQKDSLDGAAASSKTEGFLHARAEDQLRNLFKEIVPLEAAASFDVLIIRDLVGIVFGAIQECSRQFRQSVATSRQNGLEGRDSKNDGQPYSATSSAAAAYWIERIVYEASAGGLLAGLWNFPAAALVVLFYIYFVNRVQQFNKSAIQDNILQFGTVLYRCIAELALTLRSCKVTLMNSPTTVQIRVLEGASLLFRMALFGSVKVEVFPCHPFPIPVGAIARGDAPPVYEVKSFSDMDTLYEFLYSHWFQGIVTSRLSTTSEYRESSAAVQRQTSSQIDSTSRRRNWFDAKRLDVAATANRLRQEVEAMMATGVAPAGSEKVRVKRQSRRPVPGTSDSARLPDSVEVEVVDPSVLPMAQPARLEFLSLVFGVTSMLIEKHQCLETSPSSSRLNAPVQILAVPANMIVLAAIKVALSLIPPHFDRLAPFLVHWVDVRCRLIQWMWKTCKQELCRRAEDKWAELWARHNPSSFNSTPRLEVRFTSQRQDGRSSTELTLTKLAEVVPEILPNVLHSMTAFYEERTDLPDDRIAREFFAKWLKSTGDGDLISHVNSLLACPSASPSILNSSEHAAKRARHEKPLEGLTSDYLRVGVSSSPLPRGVAAGHPPGLVPILHRQSPLIPPVQSQTGKTSANDDRAKRPRRPGVGNRGNQPDGVDELGEWLETLPYSERVRLDALEVPEWELPHALKISPSDLLKWRPLELLQPFSGNGFRGPPFSELRRCDEDTRPLSDLDWKVIRGVLGLLISRGVDTLVSRRRGHVFFLDQLINHHPGEDLRIEPSSVDSDLENDDRQRLIKKQMTKKSAVGTTVAQKRYGVGFFKQGDPLAISAEEELRQHIPNLDNVRSFLEFS